MGKGEKKRDVEVATAWGEGNNRVCRATAYAALWHAGQRVERCTVPQFWDNALCSNRQNIGEGIEQEEGAGRGLVGREKQERRRGTR